jgi:mono/diheme cytochrome c family protein
MPKYPANQISDEDLQAMYAWWQNPVPAPTEPVTDAVTGGAGQDPWTQSACTSCHGRDALGGSGPGLAGTSQPFSDFVAVVRQGAPGMPGYPEAQLGDESLQAMYGWLQAQAEAVTPAPTFGPERDVWATWACAGCHGRDALGGSGPGLAGTPRPFAEFQSVVRQGAQGMPAFSEAQISDEMLQAMHDWLQAQAPEPDAAGQPAQWMEASCGACHGANAEGASATALTLEDLSFEEFEQAVRGGEEGMPAYGTSQISDTDLRKMYDWITGLR